MIAGFVNCLSARGVRDRPVCPAFPLVFSGSGPCGGLGGQVVAVVGGPQVVVNSASHEVCQGQSCGRCIRRRRAERARRAGTAIRCRRMVAVVALAWKTACEGACRAGEVERDRGQHQPRTVCREGGRGQVRQCPTAKVGVDLFDDRVGAVGALRLRASQGWCR